LHRSLDLLKLQLDKIERMQTSQHLHEEKGKEEAFTISASLLNFAQQRRHVLSIGINSYLHAPSLAYATRDAEELVSALKSSNLRNVQAQLLKDAAATKIGIREAMDEIVERAEENDQVWLFFAGQGVQQGDVGYFIPHDGDPARLSASAISVPEIGAWLRRLKSKQIIVISDTCHSGTLALAMHRGLSVLPRVEGPSVLVAGRGKVIITAGTADQLSFEEPSLQHGFFSYYLIRGLMGEADGNGDSLVTVNELYAFLSSEIQVRAKSRGFVLTPTLTTSEYSDFPLVVVRGKVSDVIQSPPKKVVR
jgi:uncharacterized caspase-like protein